MRKKIVIIVAFLLLTGAIYFGIKMFVKEDSIKTNNNSDNPSEEKKLQIVDLNSKTRPIAVMINNHTVARPLQSGLQDAYIVYEIIVEGGFTRLMAVYKDQDTARIGSLRSARDYYVDYAMENDAIYFHFGGSPEAYNTIKKYGVDDMDFMVSAEYWRDKTLGVPTEHTAFSSMEKINSSIAKKKIRSTSDNPLLFNYSVEPIEIKEGSQAANDVIIEYSGNSEVQYKYNPITKVYERSFNDVKNIDYVTKKQYTTKNIIVYKVKDEVVDNYGRREISNIGNGEGYYITEGYAIPITWTKSARNKTTTYKYLDGKEIILNDGNTFIQIMPTGKDLQIY
jgi:hypothetical protein